MGTIYIDGKPYEADPQNNLLHVCLSLGFDLPYFCWHPALNSVGACRQCAVKQFKDERIGLVGVELMDAARDQCVLELGIHGVRDLRGLGGACGDVADGADGRVVGLHPLLKPDYGGVDIGTPGQRLLF